MAPSTLVLAGALIAVAVALSSLSLVSAYEADTCAAAPAKPEDRRADKSRLVVMTFNVEWLFSAPTSYPSPWKTAAESDAHLRAVATFIKTMDPMPDMFALEEVQDCSMLAALAALLPAPAYKGYLVPGTDSATGQNVALLTRVDPDAALWRSDARAAYPMADSRCGYTGSASTSGVSKHFFAQFTLGQLKLALAAAHFVAFPLDPARCAQREAQAAVMREVLESKFLANGYEAIVLGDLNDYSSDVPDVASDKPTSRVVTILSAGLDAAGVGAVDVAPNGTITKGAAGATAAAATKLFQVSSLIAQKDRYTSAYDGNKLSQIDHLLITPGLQRVVASAWIDHASEAKVASDHWPLAVALKTD